MKMKGIYIYSNFLEKSSSGGCSGRNERDYFSKRHILFINGQRKVRPAISTTRVCLGRTLLMYKCIPKRIYVSTFIWYGVAALAQWSAKSVQILNFTYLCRDLGM